MKQRTEMSGTSRSVLFLPILPVLFLLTVLMLSGCSRQTALHAAINEESGRRLQIVATIFPQYDFARQITGDNADVYMLLKPGEEVHSYEPTPQDIKMIQNCDLFIFTGGENDVWVENILSSVGEEGPRVVRLLDLVETCEEEHLEGMMPEKGQHDHDHGHTEAHEDVDDHTEAHEHDHEDVDGHNDDDLMHTEDHDRHHSGGEPDEHVWTSPENCVILIEKLTDIICETDPSHAEEYRGNGNACRMEFEQLDREYREMADSAARRTILFGDRFPFRYLAQELGLTCYAAFSGCSSESEPSAATIAFLIDKAAEEKLPVVFKIEFSNGNIAAAVSEAAQKKLRKEEPAAQKKLQKEEPAVQKKLQKEEPAVQKKLQKEEPEVREESQEKEESSGAVSEAERPAAEPDSGNAEDADKKPQGSRQMRVLQLHSCHNLTRDEMAAGETCLSLMKKNLEALREALN